jgi:hypothetical protein
VADIGRQLEELIGKDEGKRGIGPLIEACKGNLSKAGALLSRIPADSKKKKNIAIITGFPCLLTECKQENDGPAGTIAIARALTFMGHQAHIITDDISAKVMATAITVDGNKFALHSFPPVETFDSDPRNSERLTKLTGSMDALVSVERSGQAADGKFYTMKARDLSNMVAPLDRMFIEAKNRGIPTVSVGDGGNELGMGSALELVKKHIPLGSKIACVTPCDYLIPASVSNWGAYALVASMALHWAELPHAETRRAEALTFLPSEEHEKQLHQVLLDCGVLDGTNGEPWCVDGMPFETSMAVLRAMHKLIR